ncbi:MAG: pyridoxal phosphate-dependent aminotransferase [Gammaproteobacteria bacterium]
MAIRLSERVQRIKPSPTLAVTARAAQLRAAGKDVIGLGAGEPDFDTPEHIKAAAIEAIKMGKTKYTPEDGTPSLKQAIIDKFQSFNGLHYTPDQILVSNGGKQCIFNMLQAFINDGDEVIIPAPFWVSYTDMTLLAGGKPVIVQTTEAQRFKITAEQLEAAITPQTRLFFINSPSNPTGMAYTKKELKALGDVLVNHPNILIATDDMYEHVLWTTEPFSNIVMACPELYDRTVVLSGVSKAYSMTGWRIGYAGGPVSLIKAMKNIQGQSTSNACSISQAAAEAALKGGLEQTQKMVAAFKKRHDYVVEKLNTIDGIRCLPCDGTFYAFFNVQPLIDRIASVRNDVEFAEYLLQEGGIALVPGSAFGAEGYLRLSYATSQENLEKALARLEQVVQKS